MSKKKLLILLILYIAFISLGLPDQALGVAWPSMRNSFGLPLSLAGIIVSISSIAGGVAGFVSGYFMKKYSVSQILICSAFMTALGMIGYSFSPSWFFILLSTVILGAGAGTIDASLNNYVSENYTSRHLIWLHGFWGIGATLGPAIMSLAIIQADSWRVGYFIIAFIQILLGMVFISTSKIWQNLSEKNTPKYVVEKKYSLLSAAPIMTLVVFVIEGAFLSCINIWFYSLMIEAREMSEAKAGSFIVAFWTSLTVGRFLLGYVAPYIGNKMILHISFIGLIIAMCLLMVVNDISTLAGLVLSGICLSGIYPTLMHETPRRYGSDFALFMTGYQAGAGIMGLAAVVPIIGVILSFLGLQYLPWILILMGILAYYLTKKVYNI